MYVYVHTIHCIWYIYCAMLSVFYHISSYFHMAYHLRFLQVPMSLPSPSFGTRFSRSAPRCGCAMGRPTGSTMGIKVPNKK